MPRAKIIFDASPMTDSQKTGVGYYVSRLFTNLEKNYSKELELTGYYFNFLKLRRQKNISAGNIKFRVVWIIPGKILSFFRFFGVQPFLEIFIPSKYDLVFFTNFVSLPRIRKQKSVLVVYDLSFLDVPEFTQEENLVYLRKFCPPSIKSADTIITISEFTRDRIHYHFPGIRAKIIVTPIPPPEKPVFVRLNRSLKSLGISENKYILFVGTIEPRKNIMTLVDAYEALEPRIRENFSLVLAGGKGWKDKEVLERIAKAQLDGLNIITPGYVTDTEKRALYSSASAFIMPSHYEGFGMPILEAMQYQIPTTISNIQVFREIAGDSSLYFDKESFQDIAAKITLLLDDTVLSKNLVKSANRRLTKYSWRDVSENVYKAII